MSVSKRSVVDDDGALTHVLEIDSPDGDDEYDTIEIRHDPDDERLMQVVAYQDDEPVYQSSFEIRDLSFEPISAIGRGERKRMDGTASMNNETPSEVPEEVQTAFNAIGMAVVPDGDWWREP